VTLLPLESAFYAIVITSCLLYFVRVVNGDVEQVYHKSVFIARECHIQVALMRFGVTRAAGGDERLIVKERQLTLVRDIQPVVAPLTGDERARSGIHTVQPLARPTYRTVEKGHGRLEERRIRVSSELAG